jgi:hypothetical protein
MSVAGLQQGLPVRSIHSRMVARSPCKVTWFSPACLAGRDDDAVDDLADGVGGFQGVIGMRQGLGQPLDPAPIGLGNVWMDVGNVLRPIRQADGETVLFGLKLGQPVGQGAMPTALLDDAHDLRDGYIRLGKFLTDGFR